MDIETLIIEFFDSAKIGLGIASLPDAPEINLGGTANDLFKLFNCSKKGFSTILWVLAKVDSGNYENLDDFFTKEGINIEGPLEDDKDGQRYNVVMAVQLYNSGGAFESSAKLGIVGALGDNNVKTLESFLSAVSPFQSHGWMGEAARVVFFSDADRIQMYFNWLGPMAESWMISHSSAGSAMFGRYARLGTQFGMSNSAITTAYNVCINAGVVPGFAIGYLPNSFPTLQLEGHLMVGTLVRVVNALKSGDRTKLRLTRLISAVCDAVSGITDDEARKGTSFTVTLISAQSRKKYVERITKAIESLTNPGDFALIVAKFGSLSGEGISYRQVTQADFTSAMAAFGVTNAVYDEDNAARDIANAGKRCIVAAGMRIFISRQDSIRSDVAKMLNYCIDSGHETLKQAVRKILLSTKVDEIDIPEDEVIPRTRASYVGL